MYPCTGNMKDLIRPHAEFNLSVSRGKGCWVVVLYDCNLPFHVGFRMSRLSGEDKS